MESDDVRSDPLTLRAIWSLPTVMPLPRGPSSSKALPSPSNKWSWVVVVPDCDCWNDALEKDCFIGVNALEDRARERMARVVFAIVLPVVMVAVVIRLFFVDDNVVNFSF